MAGGEQGTGRQRGGGRTERQREQLRGRQGRASRAECPRDHRALTPGLRMATQTMRGEEGPLGEWMSWASSAHCLSQPFPKWPLPVLRGWPWAFWLEEETHLLGLDVGGGSQVEVSGKAEKQKEQEKTEKG